MARALNPLAIAVLHLLAERPMHPYELQQEIKYRHIHGVVKLAHGSLYHAVDRLARDRLVAPVETSRAGRRPERTVYALTDAGRDALTERLCDLLASPATEYPQFSAALALMTSLDPMWAATQLERRVVFLDGQLASVATVLAGLAERGLDRHALLEVEYHQAVTRAERDYVSGLVTDIRAGRVHWQPGSPRSAEAGSDREGTEIT